MAYSVIDERNKLYAIAPTYLEAKEIMDELIAYADGDNWCGLAVVETDDEVDEIYYM